MDSITSQIDQISLQKTEQYVDIPYFDMDLFEDLVKKYALDITPREIEEVSIVKLIKAFKAKNIKINLLGLRFDCQEECNDLDYINDVFEEIQSMIDIKHLIIDFTAFNRFNKKYPQKLQECLSTLIGIKKLELKLQDSWAPQEFKLKDEDLVGFDIFYANLINLETYDLTIDYAESISNSGLVSALKGIDALVNLNSFCLNIPDCTKLTNDGTHIFTNELAKIPNLLNLKLFMGGIKNSGIQKLGESLQQILTLKKLNIDFTQIFFDSAGCAYLTEALKHLTNLESLKINFNKTNITDESIFPFSEAIKTLTKLKSLHLRFWIKYIFKGKSIKALAKSIMKLRALKSFRLDVESLADIEDKTIEILSNSLSYIGTLKNLNLHLVYTDITSLSLKYLTTILQKNPNINKLDLNLYGCENLTNEYLEPFMEAIKNLNLINVNLNLDGCQLKEEEVGKIEDFMWGILKKK